MRLASSESDFGILPWLSLGGRLAGANLLSECVCFMVVHDLFSFLSLGGRLAGAKHLSESALFSVC